MNRQRKECSQCFMTIPRLDQTFCEYCWAEVPWRISRPVDHQVATFKELHFSYVMTIHYYAMPGQPAIPSVIANIIADFIVWVGPFEGTLVDVVWPKTNHVFRGLVTDRFEKMVTIRYIGWKTKWDEEMRFDDLRLFPEGHLTNRIIIEKSLGIVTMNNPKMWIQLFSVVVYKGFKYNYLAQVVQVDPGNAQKVAISVAWGIYLDRPYWVWKENLSLLNQMPEFWLCTFCATKKNVLLWCRECGALWFEL